MYLILARWESGRHFGDSVIGGGGGGGGGGYEERVNMEVKSTHHLRTKISLVSVHTVSLDCKLSERGMCGEGKKKCVGSGGGRTTVMERKEIINILFSASGKDLDFLTTKDRNKSWFG